MCKGGNSSKSVEMGIEGGRGGKSPPKKSVREQDLLVDPLGTGEDKEKKKICGEKKTTVPAVVVNSSPEEKEDSVARVISGLDLGRLRPRRLWCQNRYSLSALVESNNVYLFATSQSWSIKGSGGCRKHTRCRRVEREVAVHSIAAKDLCPIRLADCFCSMS